MSSVINRFYASCSKHFVLTWTCIRYLISIAVSSFYCKDCFTIVVLGKIIINITNSARKSRLILLFVIEWEWRSLSLFHIVKTILWGNIILRRGVVWNLTIQCAYIVARWTKKKEYSLDATVPRMGWYCIARGPGKSWDRFFISSWNHLYLIQLLPLYP